MQPTDPIPRAVDITEPAGLACTMGRWEASRLHHPYVGPTVAAEIQCALRPLL
jgi:hypothetical protein